MAEVPTVSIVIPTFNRPDYLRASIKAALAQTAEAEVIVVDHGSDPSTSAVAEDFSTEIVYVRREMDSGPVFAWLDGVLHATGEYVNLHFDDDLMHPDFLARCLELVGPSVGMVFTGARIVEADGTTRVATLYMGWSGRTGVHGRSGLRRRLRTDLVSPCAAIFRRTDMIDALYLGRLPFQRSGYHGVGPDFLLQQLALLRYPKVGFVREELAVFRHHSDSITVDAIATARLKEFDAAYAEVMRHAIDLRFARGLRASGLSTLAFALLDRRRGAVRFRRLIRRGVRSVIDAVPGLRGLVERMRGGR